MEKIFFSLGNISAYSTAASLSDYVWDCVRAWDWFAKRTVGGQFIEAVDSIGANIAEGFGRYHKKDKMKFDYNARGSTHEAMFWCEKAFQRRLLTHEQHDHIMRELQKLPKEINILIKITNNLAV